MKILSSLVVMVALFQSLYGVEKLRIYEESSPLIEETSDDALIAAHLNQIGVRFETWEANGVLSDNASSEEIIHAYQSDVDMLIKENGYRFVDVIRMVPEHPKKEELRQKFLSEHSHSEDEVRFFVEGSALFYLHVEGKVYIVRCEKGDLIGIPANYRHWFDMGANPSFAAIRFFLESDGWIARFTESGIAAQFPRFEN